MITSWVDELGLNFGSVKTVAILFSHKLIQHSILKLTAMGKFIEYAEEAKYLNARRSWQTIGA